MTTSDVTNKEKVTTPDNVAEKEKVTTPDNVNVAEKEKVTTLDNEVEEEREVGNAELKATWIRQEGLKGLLKSQYGWKIIRSRQEKKRKTHN